MKRRIAAAVFVGALLVPAPVAATATAAPMLGSSEIGCTNGPCPFDALFDLLGALGTGSAKGGKPAA
ncbi:hypothetical protein [Nocardia sp. XZ_19_385]|uniref:hypothetical protein n=1 Tax=Nocardia sp. XZ_19_385 TaxID=2769488 RepID=UPI00188F1860|nr:hypothetical protein [Nocardia sp. XZ_19_385]